MAGHNVSMPEASRTRISGNFASRAEVDRIFCSMVEVCGLDPRIERNSAVHPDGERYITVPSGGGCIKFIGSNDTEGFRSGVMYNSPFAARLTLNLNRSRRGQGA